MPHERQHNHVDRSVQSIVQRINEELVKRGYRTWFDLVNMKGSTMDAMSDAVDNAAVMLYGVSLACKHIARHCTTLFAEDSTMTC